MKAGVEIHLFIIEDQVHFEKRELAGVDRIKEADKCHYTPLNQCPELDVKQTVKGKFTPNLKVYQKQDSPDWILVLRHSYKMSQAFWV